MKRAFLALLVLAATAGAVAACPNWQHPGMQSFYTNGPDLWSPNSYSVVAGGNQSLRNCGFNHSGYVISRPDFEFAIDGLQGYNRLNLRVNANCDTILLVNDSTGNWWFDDDGGNGLNPSVDVHSPANGTWDVWIGTYGQGTCNATLTLETF
jgi:hypothetical protein